MIDQMQIEEYERKIREFYQPLLAEHGDATAAVGYPEAAGQQGRYVMLCEVGDLKRASISAAGSAISTIS
ncbi:MAG: hypothetical protein VW835_03990 [Rickettsiales bacterium]